MKEIKFDGVEVSGGIQGRIAGNGDITVLKMSHEGMLFEASTRLNINQNFTFMLRKGSEQMNLTGKVVSVLIKSQETTQTAVEFVNLRDREKVFIHAVMDESIEEKMPEIKNRSAEIKS